MRALSFFWILLLIASLSSGTIFNVPFGLPTIQGAINVASDADTILVAPGIYSGAIDYNGKSLVVMSLEGPEETIIQGVSGTTVLIDSGEDEETTFEGFTIRGGQIAMKVSSAATVRNNIFTDQTITNWAALLLYDRAKFINNTVCFAANGGIACYSKDVVIKNNIIAFNSHYGIYASKSVTCSYNDIYENPENYMGGSIPGVGSISTDPIFTDMEARNYRLRFDSPCINAGDPDSLYNDLDHTRNDMGGVRLYAPVFPLVYNIRFDNDLPNAVVNNTPTIHWSFIPISSFDQQYKFELEIGTDSDWAEAEMLATGEVISSDSSYVYDGNPLVDGESYFLRIRGNDFDEWSNWSEIAFRMKTVPGVPLPDWPVGGDAPCRTIALTVANSDYEEQFPLTYEFEIYSDLGLTELFDSDYGVPEGDNFTSSKLFSGFEIGDEYWWRARAVDPFEASAWSQITSFVAQQTHIIMVPDEQPTIQAAIDAADVECGDIIKVAPGEYYESFDFKGKSVMVTSMQGAKNTIIHSPAGSGTIVRFVSDEDFHAVLSGFSFDACTGPRVVEIDSGATPVIEDNIFRGFTGRDVVIRVRTDAVIKNNLFYDNLGKSCIGISDSASPQIINNTFANNLRGLYNLEANALVRNNIITNSALFGVLGEIAQADYNDIYANNPDYYFGAAPGPHDISADPLFADTSADNYRLQAASPCIDAGDPDIRYSDPDSSRNDMGAYFYNTNPHVLHVPDAYETIQAAIDDAADGDTILVADGIYKATGNRDISLNGKSITVRSEWGPDNCTIDCESLGRGFDISGGEDSTAAIVGFTIINGAAAEGGGMRISGGASPLIDNCSFEYCSALYGGGLYVTGSSGQAIRECRFKSSLAAVSGGGFYCEADTGVLLLSHCLFHGNTAANGGAATAGNSAHVVFENCTFFENAATVHGSALYQAAGQEIDLTHCLLAYNRSPEPFWYDAPCVLTVSCTNIYANAGGDWSSNPCLASMADVDGNLSADPLFCDTASGNFDLMNLSPCAPSNNTCGEIIGAAAVGCWPKPLITSLAIPNDDLSHVVNHTPEFSWQYLSPYLNRQDSMQIALGVDDDWDNAEFWDPGPLATANTTIIYTGDSLVDDSDYYVRLRIFNGIVWSDWKQVLMHMNNKPSVPVLRTPHDSSVISVASPTLWVANSSDTEGDTVVLDFKVEAQYLTWDSAVQISQQLDSTGWETDSLPFENNRFVWTARAYDGFEYSDWADPYEFWLNRFEQIPTFFVLNSPPYSGEPQAYDYPVVFYWSAAYDFDPFDSLHYKLVVALDENFQFTSVRDSIYDTSFVDTSLNFNNHYYWRVFAYDTKDNERKCYEDFDFYTWTLGDVNKDFRTNVGDIIFLINWCFKSGPPPDPFKIGDLNGDCKVNVGDPVYLINHVFKNGQGPRIGCAE